MSTAMVQQQWPRFERLRSKRRLPGVPVRGLPGGEAQICSGTSS